MARRMLLALSRALTEDRPDPDPHFHNEGGGQPAACYDVRCARPRLDVA